MDMYSGYYSDRSTQGAPFNGAPFGIDFNLSSSFACRQFFGSGLTDTAIVRNHHGNEEKNINNASTSLQTNNPHTVLLGTIAAWLPESFSSATGKLNGLWTSSILDQLKSPWRQMASNKWNPAQRCTSVTTRWFSLRTSATCEASFLSSTLWISYLLVEAIAPREYEHAEPLNCWI